MRASHLLAPKYWGHHSVALVLVCIAGALGAWQWDSAMQQRQVESRDLTRIAPEPLDDILGPDDPFPGTALGQPVLLEGTWVPDSTVHVEKRYDGTPGFWVVTPLAIDRPGDPAVLVVRGWSETVAAAPAPPTGRAELVGLLQPTEGTRGVVDDDPTDDVLPQLRLADAIQHVDQDLYDAYVVVATEVDQDNPDVAWPVGEAAVNAGTDGLAAVGVEHLPEPSRSTGLRNFLYAIEWWIFGGFVVFIWWRWVRDEGERVGSEP